jgi:hypothetical protein
MPCGLRLCPSCDASARARHAVRAEGFLAQFHTLGVPTAYGTLRRAWRKITKDVGRLTRELRRKSQERGQDDIHQHRLVEKMRREQSEGREQKKHKKGWLEIAWCIEPHESGYPHIHFATNTRFLRYGWLRAIWSRITKCRIERSKTKEIYAIKGVCRYMAEYIAKTQFPADILCLVKGQRLFYSTFPVKWKMPEGWTVDTSRNEKEMLESTRRQEGESDEIGRVTKESKDGKYAVDERVTNLILTDIKIYKFMPLVKHWEGQGTVNGVVEMMSVLAARHSGEWAKRKYHRHRRKIRLTSRKNNV